MGIVRDYKRACQMDFMSMISSRNFTLTVLKIIQYSKCGAAYSRQPLHLLS